ncbi:hypothetical protein DFH09DRAFT_1493258, partial [Mycena vulgaris]
TFLSELAANASAHGVGIIFYSGNDDSLVGHRGTEVVIQNMTFGSVQGLTRQPSTPFTDDQGNFTGIIHQERGLTYALFQNAGHLVPQSVPGAAFSFVRDFVVGSKTTGLVENNAGTVNGGEDSNLKPNYLPGNTVIYYGGGTPGRRPCRRWFRARHWCRGRDSSPPLQHPSFPPAALKHWFFKLSDVRLVIRGPSAVAAVPASRHKIEATSPVSPLRRPRREMQP